uniref:MYB family protein n=1 Tax=Rhizophora mucronata TaxID=61149 RepID=A0A2P2JIE9_RHIMU
MIPFLLGILIFPGIQSTMSMGITIELDGHLLFLSFKGLGTHFARTLLSVMASYFCLCTKWEQISIYMLAFIINYSFVIEPKGLKILGRNFF